MFQINLTKKILNFKKILKNKLLDLDKSFYYQNCSNIQIYKQAILNLSKKNLSFFKFFIFSIKKLKIKKLY